MFELNHFKTYSTSDRLSDRSILTNIPFDSILQQWAELRSIMIRNRPSAFNRTEWAYLIEFLGKSNLSLPLTHHFGSQQDPVPNGKKFWIRPRGLIGLWLPNNVSLLGPLTLVYISVAQCPLWVKAGSHAEDLTSSFVKFALEHLSNGPLKDYLTEKVKIVKVDRNSEANRSVASEAMVRIVFGSNEAAKAIHSLPHPLESTEFSFVDHTSEAWMNQEGATDEALEQLIRVFAVYGKAGCTSPQQLILLDATEPEADKIRSKLAELWTRVLPTKLEPHFASQNLMASQVFRGVGAKGVHLAHENSAIITGQVQDPGVKAAFHLPVIPLSTADAVERLSENIQTIGLELGNQRLTENHLLALGRKNVRRIVRINQMHHFNFIWDGQDFWRQLFNWTEIS